ncbi:LuxR C-terminal-related transcriptional regulator [Nocardia sp. NPDC005366]|uniref:helix-turn-helix transcriptional regulator n=1 Tax=Nocardia sp. NPDC005366 TaxID=3156878 RepID=UPI0033AA157B
MTLTIERFSAIVALINRAALHSGDWPPAVRDIVAAVGGYHGGLVVSGASRRRMTVCSPGADDLRRSYNAGFWRIDPFARALEREPAGVITTCEELLGPQYLRRHPFFEGWMVPNRLGNGMLAVLSSGGEMSWVGVYPDRDRDLDRVQAASVLRLLLPHLRQALTVQSCLTDVRTERDRAIGVLDVHRHGLVIVSSGGAISYANPSALSILESRDGLCRGRSGHLESSDNRSAAVLRTLIDSAIRAGGPCDGGRTLVPRRSGAGQYALLVAPLNPKSGCREERSASALVVIVDPGEAITGGPKALRELFGLTAAEARVAAAALRGEGLRSIAEELSVSVNTVRTHLQHAFEKTGTHRQAELVRVLTTILAGTGQFEGTANQPGTR